MTASAHPTAMLSRDVAAGAVGDMQRDALEAVGIDIAGCQVHIVCQAFNAAEQREFEAGRIGLRFETWPMEIRAALEEAIADFVARQHGAVVAVTTAINRGSDGHGCVLALHWRPKA